jgi:methionine--tRNA ligase
MTATACITTPIYYVNDRPHIGHVFTTTLCDVWARAMRLRGVDTFFLTGTDEHGVKVEKSAVAHGVTPQAWADRNAAEFEAVLRLFGQTNDDFIRTTQPRHERQVQAMVERLHAAGALTKGSFEGWYDEGEENYLTETRAKECNYLSPVSGRPLVRAKEENWYFRLSAFAERLEAFFAEHPDFVRPAARRNEVLGRLREGLQDVPITRTNFTWGIPMPGDPGHVIYVWIDALLNYVTALGLGDGGTTERHRFWPAQYHVIGKEILWFHAVIWPAMLMALGLPLPRCVYAHSFWISEGQKMSKSLGNFIDVPALQAYVDRYGLDALRWFMVTRGPLEATDADFRAATFHETYMADLVNTVGNCSSRVSAMITKTFEGVMPADAEGGGPWPAGPDGPLRTGCRGRHRHGPPARGRRVHQPDRALQAGQGSVPAGPRGQHPGPVRGDRSDRRTVAGAVPAAAHGRPAGRLRGGGGAVGDALGLGGSVGRCAAEQGGPLSSRGSGFSSLNSGPPVIHGGPVGEAPPNP